MKKFGRTNEYLGQDHKIPVMFITQVIGLAIGLKPETLGLHRHMVTVPVVNL